MIQYFDDFYNWHLSISLLKWVQTNKIKSNQMRHVQIWQHFPLFTNYYDISMTFQGYFLVRFISKLNNSNSREKMVIIWFYSANIKGNWTHLAEEKLLAGAKINKYYICIIIKSPKNNCFALSIKIMLF